MMKSTFVALFSLASVAASGAAVVIDSGTYSQNFDSIASGLPPGWSVYTGASASALGSAASFNTAVTGWGTASPSFRNSANPEGLVSASSSTNQNKSTNRSLGLSLGSIYGNPGGSFDFDFSTLGMHITEIRFDALMFRPGVTSSGWSIQYGTGASPATWTTLGVYSSATWGSTTLSYDSSDFGTALDNQPEVWFRFVATSQGSGSPYDNVGLDNFSLTAAAIPEPVTPAFFAIGVCFLSYGFCRHCGKIDPKDDLD